MADSILGYFLSVLQYLMLMSTDYKLAMLADQRLGRLLTAAVAKYLTNKRCPFLYAHVARNK